MCALCSSRNRGKRRNVEYLVDLKKESGEDYVKRILEFLETAREGKRRKKKEEDNGTKWNVSAGLFYPAGEKEETDKNQGGEEGGQMKLYPQS